MMILKDKKGITVIEVMMAILILAVIFGMIVGIVSFFSNFYSGENSSLNRQENFQVLMINLERDVRFSDQKIDFSTAGSSCYIIGTPGVLSSNTYCFSNNHVTRNGIVIARQIETFELSTLSSAEINVNVETIADSRGQKLQADFTIYLRQGSE